MVGESSRQPVDFKGWRHGSWLEEQDCEVVVGDSNDFNRFRRLY